MPLIKKATKAARAQNIKILVKEGRPPAQAVAISYSMQREAKRKAGARRGSR